MNLLKVFLFDILLIISHLSLVQSATMGIDLGGQFIKVSIVTPRKLMETALDRDSNRKTISAIGFKDGRLVFSDAAMSLYRRQPENVVRNLDILLGHKIDDLSIVKYRELNPYLNITSDENNTGLLIHFNKFNLTFTPIELFAIWLNEIKEYTSAYANLDLVDTLIAVNPSIYQAEIDAIISAAKLSKINLMEISDHSRTIATQFIVGRKRTLNETSSYVMFVDVGAETTLVTIARVGLEPGLKKNTTVGSFNVTGIGFERVGGADFNQILQNYMIDDFTKTNKITKDLHKDHKINLKFLTQAIETKHVLTASKEAKVFMEEVYDYKNYQTIIKQTDIEEKGSEILARIGNAIDRAIQSARITVDALTDVILMGGGSLMPSVQEVIQKITKHVPSRVVNTDESNAAGASILAAKAHKFMNVAEFKSPAVIYYPIEIETTFPVLSPEGETVTKTQIDLLYPFLAKQSAKKVLSLSNVTGDFSIRARYSRFPLHLNIEDLDSRDIALFNITGVKQAIEKNPQYIPRHVSVHFRIDVFRRLTISHAEYVLEKNQSDSLLNKMGKAVMDLFSIGSHNTTESEDSNNNTVTANNTNSTINETGTTVNETEVKTDSRKPNLTVPLTIITELLYQKPPTEAELQISRSKLAKLYQEERIRTETIKARSDVDNSIFEAERNLESGEMNEYFTEEERANATVVVSQVKEWFDNYAHEANSSAFKSKLSEIRKALSPAKNRIKDRQELDNSIELLQTTVNRSQQLLSSIFQLPELSNLLSHNETMRFINLSIEARNFISNVSHERQALKPTDPIITSVGEIRLMIRDLEQSSLSLYSLIQQAIANKTKQTPTEKPIPEIGNETILEANETVTDQDDQFNPSDHFEKQNISIETPILEEAKILEEQQESNTEL